MNYVIYNTNGEILKTVSCDPSMIGVQLSTGESYIEGTCNDELEYVLNDKVEPKITMGLILTNGPDFTLSGLPIPSTVTIDDQAFEVPDGVLEFTIDQVGTYDIKCVAQNHLPETYTVTI